MGKRIDSAWLTSPETPESHPQILSDQQFSKESVVSVFTSSPEGSLGSQESSARLLTGLPCSKDSKGASGRSIQEHRLDECQNSTRLVLELAPSASLLPGKRAWPVPGAKSPTATSHLSQARRPWVFSWPVLLVTKLKVYIFYSMRARAGEGKQKQNFSCCRCRRLFPNPTKWH